MTKAHKLPQGFVITESVDSRFMVLKDGIQWGGGLRDASGASSETWDSYAEAQAAVQLYQEWNQSVVSKHSWHKPIKPSKDSL